MQKIISKYFLDYLKVYNKYTVVFNVKTPESSVFGNFSHYTTSKYISAEQMTELREYASKISEQDYKYIIITNLFHCGMANQKMINKDAEYVKGRE